MATPRLLQREKYIRMAGILLMLSPFVNFAFSIVNALGPRKLTQPVFMQILNSLSMFFILTTVVAIATGYLMIKGRRSSWLSVLGLLGAFIVFNIINIRTDLAASPFFTALNLLINLSLFGLVYSQEFHQIAQRKGLELIRKMRETKQNGPVIHFEEHGPWAKLIAITTTHVSMRAIGQPPADIESRIMEIVLSADLVLRTRFIQQQENKEYFFEFIEMDSDTRHRLEDWLVLKKYARFTAPQVAA